MTDDRLSALLREASRLEHDIRSGEGPDLGEDVARRLRDSVIAPLRRAAAGDGGPGGDGGVDGGADGDGAGRRPSGTPGRSPPRRRPGSSGRRRAPGP
ncbi:hypothetical protein ACWDR9_19865, partial [Streptosporangium sandarakinum]